MKRELNFLMAIVVLMVVFCGGCNLDGTSNNGPVYPEIKQSEDLDAVAYIWDSSDGLETSSGRDSRLGKFSIFSNRKSRVAAMKIRMKKNAELVESFGVFWENCILVFESDSLLASGDLLPVVFSEQLFQNPISWIEISLRGNVPFIPERIAIEMEIEDMVILDEKGESIRVEGLPVTIFSIFGSEPGPVKKPDLLCGRDITNTISSCIIDENKAKYIWEEELPDGINVGDKICCEYDNGTINSDASGVVQSNQEYY